MKILNFGFRLNCDGNVDEKTSCYILNCGAPRFVGVCPHFNADLLILYLFLYIIYNLRIFISICVYDVRSVML